MGKLLVSTRKRKPSTPREVICITCGKTFWATHSQAKYCPEKCRQLAHRAMWYKYNDKNREKRNEYKRRYAQRYRELNAEKIKAYVNSPGFKILRSIRDAERKLNYPEKYAARQKVLIAVRNGSLVKQPCKECGALKVEAHHPDYSKPLDVIWLCKKHHMEYDKKNGGI